MAQKGLFLDIPAADYRAIEALNASGAKQLLKSPAHFLADKQRERTQTASMLLGSLVHSFLLEPDTVEKLYACMPKIDRRTTAGKQAYEEFCVRNAGKIVVDFDTWAKAQRICAAVKAKPAYEQYIAGAQTEVTLLWDQWGVACKARLDAFKDNLIVDIKTTTDASPAGFAKAVASFSYHVQAAHYLAGVKDATGWEAAGFVFIAVEVDEPHEVGVYSLDVAAIAEGTACMFEAAEAYKIAMDETVPHKGYSTDVVEISLPGYATRRVA